MKQTIVLSYSFQWKEYVVTKLVNRVTPLVGTILVQPDVERLLAEAKVVKQLSIEIYSETRRRA